MVFWIHHSLVAENIESEKNDEHDAEAIQIERKPTQSPTEWQSSFSFRDRSVIVLFRVGSFSFNRALPLAQKKTTALLREGGNAGDTKAVSHKRIKIQHFAMHQMEFGKKT